MLKSIAPMRGVDDWGSGLFGASRGSRTHNGEDLVMSPGSLILSPVSGTIDSFGFAYSDDPTYQIVNIEDSLGNLHRLFYVRPLDSLSVGSYIKKDDLVGEAQDIAERYSELTIKGGDLKSKIMKNHIHYEIRNSDGNPIDPKDFHRGGI